MISRPTPSWQGDSVRASTTDIGAQRSLGERGQGPRHAGVRGGVDSTLVASDGCGAYREATTPFITADAGREQRVWALRAWKHELQQLADETRTDHRAFSTRHQQVEQDRGTGSSVNHGELAGTPPNDDV